MALFIVTSEKTFTLLVAVLFACVIVGHSVITEATYKRCISDANQKFATLTESIYKSDSFFGTINNLKCIYLDLIDSKLDDTVPCETERTTRLNLNTTRLFKLRDMNKKEDVALQRYAQLISDFFPNLVDLEAFEVNVTNRKSYVGMIKNITRQLLKIQKNMTNVAKAYRFCYQKIQTSVTRIIPDRVILPFNEPLLISVGFKQEELAGAIFKQMQTVFFHIKDELFYRKGCIF